MMSNVGIFSLLFLSFSRGVYQLRIKYIYILRSIA